MPPIPKPISPLERRIPTNPKYASVRSKIDSGSTMKKYMEKNPDYKINARYKKIRDMPFKRIKKTTIIRWLAANTLAITPSETLTSGESIYSLAAEIDPTLKELAREKAAATMKSDTMTSLTEATMACGDAIPYTFDATQSGYTTQELLSKVPDITPAEYPFVLFDMREPEEFKKKRLSCTVNITEAELKRSTCRIPPPLCYVATKPECIIVLLADSAHHAQLVSEAVQGTVLLCVADVDEIAEQVPALVKKDDEE